jgi:ankyrin repeat protein
MDISEELKELNSADQQLFLACYNLDVDKAAEAIRNGANVNATIEECGVSNITPLLYAIDNTAVFTDDWTFDFAVEKKCFKVCRLLLDNGADINAVAVDKDNDGKYFCNWSALLYANYCSAGVTRFLLENGAKTDIKLEYGAETILDHITEDLHCHTDEPDLQKEAFDHYLLLLEFGAKSCDLLEEIATLPTLSSAGQLIRNGCWHLNCKQIQQAFDLNWKPEKDENFRPMRGVINDALQFEYQNYIGNLPELEKRMIEGVKVLLSNGIDINSDEGDALYWAVYNGLISITEFLFKNGASADLCICGSSPFRCRGHLRCCIRNDPGRRSWQSKEL